MIPKLKPGGEKPVPTAPATVETTMQKRVLWPVGIVFLLGTLLAVFSFFNLRYVEDVLRDNEAALSVTSGLQETSWFTLLSGLGFTGLLCLYLVALLRKIGRQKQDEAEMQQRLDAEAALREKAEEEVDHTRKDMDRRVQERTQELADTNKFMLKEIGERKRAEADLEAQKDRLAITLRSIADGVIATDAAGRIVLMNRVAEMLTGWSQDDATKRSLHEVFRLMEEGTGQPQHQLVERIVTAGEQIPIRDNMVLLAKDGTERMVSGSGAPIYDRANTVSGTVIAFRDMTERKRIDEERMKTQKLESIALLAGGIAHDYNNLLTAIMGNLSLAQMAVSETPEEIPSLLNEVENASLRAKDLTHQLLTFAKGGAPIRQTAALPDMLRDSAQFVLRGSATTCEFRMVENTWPAEVDLGQISQVIQNLVINADQAMPTGGKVVISTDNISVETPQPTNAGQTIRPGRYVRIAITDNGPGIPADIMGKIFDPYFTTKEKGSGLGLTTSYAIIKKHEGYLVLESKVGKGTTFFIYLPAVDEPVEQQSGKPQPLILRGNGKILVMDDEESVRTTVKRMLESVGYKVNTARNGEEAIRMYDEARHAQPFDAVMLDLTVPGGMGGKETIRQLSSKHPSIKAIVSSGYVNDPVMQRFRKHGFVGVVTKPYTLGDLTYAFKRILG
jgi:PAS domain S-box-containing protein